MCRTWPSGVGAKCFAILQKTAQTGCSRPKAPNPRADRPDKRTDCCLSRAFQASSSKARQVRHYSQESSLCTRYISPEEREIEAFWKIDRRTNQRKDWESLLTVFPLSLACLIRRADEVEYARELVVGRGA